MFFEINGSKSSDDNTALEGLAFRWDFESDGIWDTDFSYNPIAVHKFNQPGMILILCEICDCDWNTSKKNVSLVVEAANPNTGLLTDPRDGQVYHIVKIHNDWWMADNLNFGRTIISDQEQSNNQIPEKYFFKDDSINYTLKGGLYLWQECLNYNSGNQMNLGICPDGWHIPSKVEWEQLTHDLDTWYAWNYFGPDGLSGMRMDNGAGAKRRFNNMIWESQNHFFWTSDYERLEFLNEAAPWAFYRGETWGSIGLRYLRSYYDGSDGLWSIGSNYASVRCIKNH